MPCWRLETTTAATRYREYAPIVLDTVLFYQFCCQRLCQHTPFLRLSAISSLTPETFNFPLGSYIVPYLLPTQLLYTSCFAADIISVRACGRSDLLQALLVFFFGVRNNSQRAIDTGAVTPSPRELSRREVSTCPRKTLVQTLRVLDGGIFSYHSVTEYYYRALESRGVTQGGWRARCVYERVEQAS